jgi:hypothetical protein
MATTYRFGPFRRETESETLFRGAEPLALGRRAATLFPPYAARVRPSWAETTNDVDGRDILPASNDRFARWRGHWGVVESPLNRAPDRRRTSTSVVAVLLPNVARARRRSQ